MRISLSFMMILLSTPRFTSVLHTIPRAGSVDPWIICSCFLLCVLIDREESRHIQCSLTDLLLFLSRDKVRALFYVEQTGPYHGSDPTMTR